ncbi:DUF7660 family protein [Marinomonas sp. PE14-40]|uniref:DUF7660 family protein n=1 Tax=Marinomonas sp. PE14-40 TaxID=3060621 RepID=UPI003F67A71B
MAKEAMSELSKLLEEVKDEKSFLLFVKSLIKDRQSPDSWENNTISDFLESSVAWAEDSDFGINQDSELETNKWKQFAVFLYCGKIYE